MNQSPKRSYENNFKKAILNIKDYIKDWPSKINQDDVIELYNLNDTTTIFVPLIIKEDNEAALSKDFFYCSQCNKWMSIHNSVKNIKRHAGIHYPDTFKEIDENEKNQNKEDYQKNDFIRNIIGFILFETNSFSLIESPFLSNITNKLPNRKKLLVSLENIARGTQKEIKSIIQSSSCNCLSFDEWTDLKNRPFLGINVRSFICGNYHDFLLDFIHLSEEINDANVLANKITKSLQYYNLNISDILSCTTDNCALMCKTAEVLDLWRIPCVLHLLNLVFKEFIKGITSKINPIMTVIKYITNSEHYEIYIEKIQKKGLDIKKVPSYNETRWTSFCDTIIVLFETKEYVREFMGTRNLFDENQSYLLEKLYNVCNQYKNIVLTYESDNFGASGFFLADISIIKELLIGLENTDFNDGVKMAMNKIKELSNTHKFFWNNIAPIALLLNPSIHKYRELLTNEQIEFAKNAIRARMAKYSPQAKRKDHDRDRNRQHDDGPKKSRYDKFKNSSNEEDKEVPCSPIERLLENRNISESELNEFWKQKVGTEDHQLALVALEILGLLVTSVLTERSFSKSRYIISNLRTNISPDHAKDQMIIKCNKDIAINVFKTINIFQDIE